MFENYRFYFGYLLINIVTEGNLQQKTELWMQEMDSLHPQLLL